MSEVVNIDERRQNKPADKRTPPHDLAAEASLLGAMLLRGGCIADAIDTGLGAEDFYKLAHSHIYAAVISLYGRGEPADPVTVSDELRGAGLLDGIGGSATLVGLRANAADYNAGAYARIVADQALLRRLIAASHETAADAYALPDDIEEAVDAAEARIYGLRRESGDPLAGDLCGQVGEWLDHVEARRDAGGLIEHPTGLVDLDELTGGLQPERLYLVAGRPGAGKSDLGCTIAGHVAQSEAVLYWSIEMSRREVIHRLIAARAHMDRSKLDRGIIAPRDWERLGPAMEYVQSLDLDIRDSPTCTILGLRAAARRRAGRNRLGLIVVDHIGLMTGRGRAENRQVEVAEFARGLKVLAREMKVPVIALVQLNRQLESRAEKRPALADLRESGELEQSADVVVGVFRPELYDKATKDRGIAELGVLKNRQGGLGTVRVAADVVTGRWTNLTRREDY